MGRYSLISAIEEGALLFTNDEGLRDMAIALGIHAICYNGLEEDVIFCIKGHNLITPPDLIEAVKVYSAEIRGEAYEERDIREAVELLKQRRIIREMSGRLKFIARDIEEEKARVLHENPHSA